MQRDKRDTAFWHSPGSNIAPGFYEAEDQRAVSFNYG